MSRIKLPGKEEILALAEVRADICLSIYVETSPLKLHADSCRIELKNLVQEALKTLAEQGHDKRRLEKLRETLAEVTEDDDYCHYQANSLVVLATPDRLWIYRLANILGNQLEISDRFFIKPLLRALAFRHSAYILALSENRVRLVELFPESGPEEIKLRDLPKDAADALGLSSMNAARGGPLERHDDRKNRLARYARKVDEAIAPLTRNCDYPVILFATEPLASIYRAASSACLAPETIFTNPDALSPVELAEQARPALDAFYAAELADLKERFETRAGQRRVATDLTDVARAATFGLVGLALVDFEKTVGGCIDDEGRLTLSDAPEVYGVIDEIVRRTLEHGGRVVAVRAEDMIGDTGVAVILRYPLSS